MRLIISKARLMTKENFLYSLREEVGHKTIKDKIMSEDMYKKISNL